MKTVVVGPLGKKPFCTYFLNGISFAVA